MPGVDLVGLESCVSDFEDIDKKCRHCFAVLARSRACCLRTISPYDSMDELLIPVELYCPTMSTGIIAEGTWGNFPSGETFTLPQKYQAHGSVTLRGSFPNHVLERDEWIRFSLKGGRMLFRSLEASSPSLRQRFASLFFQRSGRLKHRNSNALAELGIGTNRHIRTLTGSPIFDEKKLHTTHIAFGSNSQFLGPLDSHSHHDLTITGATLEADGTSILRNGVYSLRADTAVPTLINFAAQRPTRLKLRSSSRVVEYHQETSPPRLTVTYVSHRGGKVSFDIAHAGVAETAHHILAFVARQERTGVTEEEILEQFSDVPSAANILSGLSAYRLLEESDPDER